MSFEGWDSVYKRHELKPIDKFKHKSRLLKEFGPNGVRLYNSLDGFKSAVEVRELLSIPATDFSKIMDFMLQNQIVLEAGGSPTDDSPGISPFDYSSSPPKDEPDSYPELSADHSLTPMEKTIFDSYGEQGLKVYTLIDGHKSARQILEDTGVSETKLVEILEFMNKRGIIKLEKPPNKSPAPPSENSSSDNSMQVPPFGASDNSGISAPRSRPRPISPMGSPPRSRPAQKNTGFHPMVENKPSLKAPMERQEGDDMVPVDIPSFPPNLSFVGKTKMRALLALKFGKIGSSLISHIDGVKDYVQISIETELAMHDLDIIFGELGKNNLLQFRQLERSEILHRYGDDGLTVYKKYGRDGLLIYQLIGKANSLKDIIKKSHIKNERAIDIIMFTHSMLGLDIPLDRDMIYRYITDKKR